MIEKKVVFIDKKRMGPGWACLVSHVAKGFSSNVNIELKYSENEGFNSRINVKSIMGMLTLPASYGKDFKIVIEGEDEKEAAEAIIRIFEVSFNELWEIYNPITFKKNIPIER